MTSDELSSFDVIDLVECLKELGMVTQHAKYYKHLCIIMKQLDDYVDVGFNGEMRLTKTNESRCVRRLGRLGDVVWAIVLPRVAELKTKMER